ncbi:MAG TPA: sodium:alanine symporter family protein [Clostridia bacterium]|nr:sodium:alanine symporter family protein [Clostridia bacterium]
MEALHEFLNWLNGYLWGPPMLILLFGTHLFLTFRLRFIQRYTKLGIKLSLEKEEGRTGDVSPFGALTTALAATIGTGNIVGVATAVGLGGPGAVLWMWLTGVFGIATKYAEGLVAVKYRVKTSDGTMLGGPMYALEKGLKMKWLAVLFCIFTSVAAFGIGNMVQINAISSLMKESFSIPTFVSGFIIMVLVGAVILGGIKSIANVTIKLIPFMAIFYVLGCLIILIFNAAYIIPAIGVIIKAAFTPQAAGGGFIGSTIMLAARYGIARGLFSNESGLGSAPIAAAAAKARNPVHQALVSSTGTFWDTVVVCAMTGLVLVTTIMKNPAIAVGLEGADLTHACFSQIPVIGGIVLTVGLLTFAFSTILGWAYYGERALEYLVGKAGIKPYRILWLIALLIGSVSKLGFVWTLADTMNALMAIPNLVALLLLSGVIVEETRKYLWSGNMDKSDVEVTETTA